ncbi:MAG: hypothetical protein PVJ20_14955, partial [Desulfobacterales bacterium]
LNLNNILFSLILFRPIENFHEIFGPSRIFHGCEVFICKAFKGAAVVAYCKPLITRQMGASHSPKG